MDPAWIALAGAVFGGIGLRLVEAWLNKDRVQVDDATQIRAELRQEVYDQRREIDELEKEVDKWRESYYELREKYSQLTTRLTLMAAGMQESGGSDKD